MTMEQADYNLKYLIAAAILHDQVGRASSRVGALPASTGSVT